MRRGGRLRRPGRWGKACTGTGRGRRTTQGVPSPRHPSLAPTGPKALRKGHHEKPTRVKCAWLLATVTSVLISVQPQLVVGGLPRGVPAQAEPQGGTTLPHRHSALQTVTRLADHRWIVPAADSWQAAR
jgi:hypothetical protein